jgi:hypothetical protein
MKTALNTKIEMDNQNTENVQNYTHTIHTKYTRKTTQKAITQTTQNIQIPNNTKLLDTKAGVDVWVLALQTSRPMSSLTGVKDAATSAY